MTEEERWKKLEELREEFRKMRPDLKLPPARRGQATSDEPPAAKVLPEHAEPGSSTELVVRKEEERSEEVKRKIQTVRDTAREQPKTIANMLKKYTDWNRKK